MLRKAAATYTRAVSEPRVARSNLLGTEFGPYRIVRRLGVGGMAETFEAVRRGPEGFEQRVCLKLALPFLSEDEEFVRLFQREARLAAKLRQSNIVGILDYGSVEGTPYMALELVDGCDLLTFLEAQGRLEFQHAVLLAVELAKGLAHAHDPPTAAGLDDSVTGLHGIVHRDLSPSNVMLSRHGEVMLTDFGVAKAMTGASRKQSGVKGKVPYMSPEQLRNQALDGRADLFSLGVVLYESLCGTRPFDGGNDPATIMLILRGEHAPLREMEHEAPDAFCEIVERLLLPERDDRVTSARELIELLDDFAPSPRAQRELSAIVTRVHNDSLSGVEEGALESSEELGETVLQDGEVVASGVSLVQRESARTSNTVGGSHSVSTGLPVRIAVVVITAGFGALMVGMVLFALGVF